MTRKPRISAIQRVRVAGEGADGAMYGVKTLNTSGGNAHSARKKPCPTCPWRKDAEIGAFPAEAFRISASTAFDGAMNTFSCHEQGDKAPATCAGFLLANSSNNIGVRIALSMDRLSLDHVSNPENVPLYGSYREMAVANGVDEADPAIAACRGDHEDGYTVAKRVRETGAYEPRTMEDIVARYSGADHQRHLD